MSDAPAFQTYPKDLFVRTAGFTNQELGAYARLEGLCWLRGALPKDVSELARLAQEPPRAFARLWARLRPLFTEHEDGILRLAHLDKQRAEHEEHRRTQAQNATRGWEKRRQQQAQGSAPPQSHGNAAAEPPQSHGNAAAMPEAMPTACEPHALRTPYSELRTPHSPLRTPSGGAHAPPVSGNGAEPGGWARLQRDCEALGVEPREEWLEGVDAIVFSALRARKKGDPQLSREEILAEIERNAAGNRLGRGGSPVDVAAAARRAPPPAVAGESNDS